MMVEALRAIVLAIWSAMGLQPTPERQELADAALLVILEDASNPPVYGSHDEDLAVEAVYLAHESGAHRRPIPSSWDALAGVSCGAWQEPCRLVHKWSALEQARYWLTLVRQAQRSCRAQPLAPVMGSCWGARRAADARVERARALLRTLF